MYTVMLYPKGRANGKPGRTPPKRVDFGVQAYSGTDRNSAERFAQAAVLDRQAVAVVREDSREIVVYDTEPILRVKSRPPRSGAPRAVEPRPVEPRPVPVMVPPSSGEGVDGPHMTSVRVINRFLDAQRSVPNGRPAVATFATGERVKIIAARTKGGQLQARLAATGKWAPVMYVTPG